MAELKLDLPLADHRMWAKHYPRSAHAFERDLSHFTPQRLGDLLRARAVDAADKPFLTTMLPNGAYATLTFAEVERATADFARYLREDLGLEKGDVVALQSPNCISYVVSILGTLRAGLVLTNVNPLYTAVETRRQLRDCKAKVLVATGLFPEIVEQAVPGTMVETVVEIAMTDFFPPLKRAVLNTVLERVKKVSRPLANRTVTFADALKAGAKHSADVTAYEAERDLSDDAILQYSGGTTGLSKGVRLTEGTLMTVVAQFTAMDVQPLQHEDGTMIIALPVYHVFGLFACLMCIQQKGHAVLVPSPRPLTNLKPAFQKFPPTVLPGVNTLFAKLLQEDWFQKLKPQITATISGATALDPAIGQAWAEATGSALIEGYGMTETTTLFALNPPADAYKPGAAGLPLPGCDLKIVGLDGEPAGPGEPGELYVNGPQMMTGYFGRDAETEAAFADGWLRTGDIGYLDADGYLFLVDRAKDMILVSGFNVFPVEVEQVLTGIEGVLEAGVVGARGPDGNEVIHAYVELDDPSLDIELIRKYIAQHLTAYKRPKHIHIMDELPRTPIGKVLRKDLRAMAAQL